MSPSVESIMFVGRLKSGSTSSHRMLSLRELGLRVVAIDTHPEDVRRKERTFLERVRKKLFGPRDLARANEAMLAAAHRESVDVVWIDRGTTIHGRTLLELRGLLPDARIVHYNPDDPFGGFGKGEWRTFLKAVADYHVHLVPREPNVEEYRAIGARDVRHVVPFWGYSPDDHRPLRVDEHERRHLGAPVGFIGMAETERAHTIADLAARGFEVKVWGDGWERYKRITGGRFVYAGPAQFGEMYAKIINSFDINLAFLRKANRDQHTSRSVELPAAGAFMLAERSDEHLTLFDEGREAEFFDDNDELARKVAHYLAHPNERRSIAARGRARCSRSGYSNMERMRSMLELVAH